MHSRTGTHQYNDFFRLLLSAFFKAKTPNKIITGPKKNTAIKYLSNNNSFEEPDITIQINIIVAEKHVSA